MKRFIVGFIPLSFTAGRPAMACVLAAALVLCASSAQGQVIEEGGFPVKGGGVSSESFSLSCPPRLYVEEGESVSLSCSATAVPEEGVRYAWESLSGDGLHLLSDAQALTPLFTAPLSGEGVEYAYRLTAMSVGVYETATVTVIVGVSGGSVQDRGKSPGLLEGCDAFGAFEGFREGCVAGDKMPPSFEPFEGGFEGEGGPGFLFPEVPDLPDRPSGPVRGGGPGPQAPPRLDCPVAVFLEELETGQVECYAWDAAGEEYLDYSWEPVGSTTRDYLDNPRLIPENSPTPSVIAPETPVYETLESFRSGETTSLYRYRLTATSRATGLSSSSEVEVYVSSSRPSVYCPLEVVVEEGETVQLDCEGVDPLSHRMDYDEESASVLWEWEGLWATSTAPLAAKDLSSPLFTAPAGSAGKEYHYIASMTSSASGVPRTARRKVTVRVVGEEDVSGPTDDFYIDCPDNDFEMYEGEASDGSRIIICSKSPYKPPKHYITSRQTYKSVASSPNAQMGATGRASQPILAIGIAWWRNSVPQFTAPPVSEDTKYVFSIRLCPRSLPEPCSEEDALASDDVTVIVLDGTRPAVTCNTPVPVYEAAADFALDCSVTNEPEGAVYNWTGTDIADRLTDTDGLAPTFSVPDNVDSDTDYEYRVTLSVNGVVQNSTDVTVRVLNRRLDVTCTDPSVYEGNSDFALHCEVDESVLQAGHEATWNWEPTDRLVNHDTGTPTFDVPAEVHSDTEYRYAVTATAENVEAGTATVTVRVLDRRDIVVSCTGASYEAYEGSPDVAFDCSASGAPSGSAYSYYWTPRGDTQDTSLLSAAGTASPTFYVPEEVDRATTYEYLLTASADNAEDGAARVAVTVLNREPLAARCADPGSVYEGSADIAFDCEASGAPAGSAYSYYWTPRGDTQDTSLLSAADIASPTFLVLEEVNATTTYEYLLTVSAENAEDGAAAVAVTVLNREPLAVRCAVPGSIYEGSADVELDCSASGAPSGSDYSYYWTAIGATANTDRLSAVDIASPTFYVPEEVDRATTYEYLLTASAENAEDGAAEVTVRVLNKEPLAVRCAVPGSIYEGSADFELDCSASDAPGDSPEYTYVWTPLGDTQDTSLLSAVDIASPTFLVPEEVNETMTYEYLLTASADNAEDATAEVTVTVLNKEPLAARCAAPGSVYEGSADFELDCSASDAPGDSPEYTYVWTPLGDTQDTSLLSAVDIASPTFYVPEEVDRATTYEYLLTASADNAEDATAEVTVTVLNKEPLAVRCAVPGSIYEGSADFELDCSASDAPGDSPEYTYVWTPLGDTQDTSLLSAVDIASPTFLVPEEVDRATTYEYLLTASADNAEDATAEVTVTVLNKEPLAARCAAPGSVYEGSADFDLDCSASDAPGDSPEYTYVWTPLGDTQDTSLLSTTDTASPTFYVPEEVNETTTYEYLLTASADNAEDATAEVTVTVLNKEPLAARCADPGSVYEGSADFELDCSASDAPGDSPEYTYVWTPLGDTQDTSLLSTADIASPTFYVPDKVDEDETYEYLLTVSADNAEDATAEVTVTVLNKEPLAARCADPGSVYEGSADFELDCSASDAPGDSPEYTYVWTPLGDTQDTSLLSAADVASPTFAVPDEVNETTTYEYLLTASADNAEDATAEVTVTVLNKEPLAARCAAPGSVYEGSADFDLDCSASDAPGDSPEYTYVWTPLGDTQDTSLLSAADIASPTFLVPEEVNETTTYEYLLTASADNAEDATAEVTVTVLNKEPLAARCADPGSVYEGSADFELDCSASDAPGDSPEYTYVWTPLGDTQDTSLLSAADIASPTFYVPDKVDEDETYEYLLTVSADNAEDATAEVTVTVLDRVQMSLSDPSAFGVTISASPLRFGVQSADTEVSLDPMTDRISTRVSGPYHAGRMTLAPGGSEENLSLGEEMNLSIEIASPVFLKRADAIEASSIVLVPSWSLAESCEQLSSQAIGGLYTEVTLSEADCRLLRFGGELDLTDIPSGRYAGSMDIILRSGESEETHSVDVEVRVVPAQQVITIGPRGVRFSTSREIPAGLTEEQNLSIYPHVAFLTEEKPHGVFELSNPSLIPLEISVSARFGYTEATENGREVVVEDASESHLGDLSEVMDIHPGVLVLMPGEKGLVRYGMKEGALAAMAEKGYAAFFDVVSQPRQYVRTDQMPEEVTGEKTARVTMRVPGVYVPAEGASQLRATLLSISFVGSMSATFLLETADHPFVGEVVAYEGDGRELGRRETLVYTRSRVRVPLDRIPEEGAVFLRFSPRGSGRVPEPASVEWYAPRRDIGDAENEGRKTIPATLVQKP